MKKIFLTSSGFDDKNVADAFLKYVGKPAADIKVAFIPTAADPEPDKSFVQWTIDELEEMGVTNIETFDLKNSNSKEIEDVLSKFDVILVNGGNTFYLLEKACESGFIESINKLLENTNRVYVGVSAGSLLAGPSVESSGWKPESDLNNTSLKDFTGAKLVNFSTFVHYKPKHEEIIKKYCNDIDYPMIALHDGDAVYIENGKPKIINNGFWLKEK